LGVGKLWLPLPWPSTKASDLSVINAVGRRTRAVAGMQVATGGALVKMGTGGK
jgi:hypothetical protein